MNMENGTFLEPVISVLQQSAETCSVDDSVEMEMEMEGGRELGNASKMR